MGSEIRLFTFCYRYMHRVGLDLGFEQQGFKTISAYDKEPYAVETFYYNRDCKVAKEVDFLIYTDREIIDYFSRQNKNIVLRGVIGGPPCQYYSNENKSSHEDDDPRRILPIKYANILKSLNEQYCLDFFLFENVKG